MDTLWDAVAAEIKYQQAQLKRYSNEYRKTRNYAKCTLTVRIYKTKRYYSLVDRRISNAKPVYLGSGYNSIVDILQKRRFLRESVRRIDQNIPLMENFLSHYLSLDPNLIRESLPLPYRFTDSSCFDIAGAIDIENWGKHTDTGSKMYTDDLRHGSIRGDRMRSKSEVLIADQLAARGIRYIYEKKLRISGHLLVPDFTILSPKTGREVYWEHFGLLSDKGYQRSFIKKVLLYTSANIVPQRDLIMTFDDYEGNIDTKTIAGMIEFLF